MWDDSMSDLLLQFWDICPNSVAEIRFLLPVAVDQESEALSWELLPNSGKLGLQAKLRRDLVPLLLSSCGDFSRVRFGREACVCLSVRLPQCLAR